MRQTLLSRLCERYGIQTEYDDIWGQRHRVPEATCRRLLQSMGVPARDSAETKAALARSEQDEWGRPLPPVLVLIQGKEPLRIPLNVARGEADRPLDWTLIEESGQRHNGRLTPSAWPVLQRHGQGDAEVLRYAFELPVEPPAGYHRFVLETGGEAAEASLIIAPERGYRPEALEGDGRVWGPSVQLYAVRSARNWGIGDFTDLKGLIEFAAENGAGIVGVSPLHALFPHNPEHASPYSPSSRQFLNTLFIDVEAVADYAECQEVRKRVQGDAFQARLRALRAAERVDYAGVAAAKGEILERLFRHFCEHHLSPDTERGRAFRAFQDEQGEPLYLQALFEALQEHFHRRDNSIWGWPAWPEGYRDPRSGKVTQFAAEHKQRVSYYQYLQWLAHLQLQSVGQRSYELGLGVGLYQDLAVSIDRGGGEAWADQSLYALDAHIGSPADDFNLKGQNWGLPPLAPQRLRENAYALFIATLRENMRSTGALRIDHVMALMRLYWIPSDSPPADGTYIHYPFHDLLGILALESRRNRCLVIGEDLGTVPTEVRDALRPLGVLSYRLLYFEKDARGDFQPPEGFPAQALVAVSTHDLPTLAGYWQGIDLERRSELRLFPSEEQREAQLVGRAEDRARLLIALDHQALLPAGTGTDPVTVSEMSTELACAVHRYLARSPAKIMMVQMEDMFGQREQMNLPGTTNQHPNWRRKLALNLERYPADPRVAAFADALRAERGSAVHALSPATTPLPRKPAIPRATYRLQFHRDFTFSQATGQVPYLAALGISHCYASPLLKARPGSSHGYDIVEHAVLNPELGNEEDFERFIDALQEHGMGLILDMVPNHMGVMGHDNPWWLDVLENGQSSEYAHFFDIDWLPLKDELRGKVLVPVLGDHYGNVLENGELRLAFDREGGGFDVWYYEHRFPIDPATYPRILGHHLQRLTKRLGEEHPDLLEFGSLITAFGNLPPRTASSKERDRDKQVHKRHLARLYLGNADIARYIDELVTTFNGAASPDLLHRLLEGQAYRLAYWRVAADEINYRRFFDINELASLQMDDPEVFQATHGRVLELIAQGKVQGLRIDHPDGLYDPRRYFQRLQQAVTAMQAATSNGPAEDGPPLYMLVEKILAAHESLPDDWQVHGTTGYDFAALCNDLFVDPSAMKPLQRLYAAFSRERHELDEIRYQSKKLIMRLSLASELNVLATQLSRIAEADTHTRDFTLNSLREALSEVVACLPVYRTYIGGDGPSEKDLQHVDWAVGIARKRSGVADISVFDFLHDVLLTTIREGKEPAYRERVVAFARKFQQFSAPVMAKGMEDTAFYRYNRLVSLNEVGADPDRFGVSPTAFHHANRDRLQHWPHALLSGSTHDSKRSEDVRARINVLTEFPDAWRTHLGRWSRINWRKKTRVDDRLAPSRNDEYLLYQTLLGAWPLHAVDQTGLKDLRRRIETYMLKAIREAKVHTSWLNPNRAYEEAVRRFVSAMLGKLENNAFLADFIPFQQTLARFGLYNSLSQLLLRLTAPGVPDIYQGNELWRFDLVDPDNRRPVDFDRRRALLDELMTQARDSAALPSLLEGLTRDIEDGRAKLYLIWRLLVLRRELPELFQEGDYLALDTAGEKAEHLCAFARRRQGTVLMIAAPRWFARLMDGRPGSPLGETVWQDTVVELADDSEGLRYVNVLTGQPQKSVRLGDRACFRAGDLFSAFPVAVLLGRRG